MSNKFFEYVGNKTKGAWNDTFIEFPELVGTLVDGVPTGIAIALKMKMKKEKKKEVSVDIAGLCEFTLTASKRGDSVSFLPGFNLTEKGIELISKDDLTFENDKSEFGIAALAMAITNDKVVMEAVSNSLAANEYSDGTWINTNREGIEWTSADDTAITIMIVMSSILEILSKTKDATQESVELEVPVFGNFKIKKVKDSWTIILDYSKEFSAACKDDVLASYLADLDFE